MSTILWALVLWWADRRAARNPRAATSARWASAGRSWSASPSPSPSSPGRRGPASRSRPGCSPGLDRATAARFAFLLGLPITVAAGLLETTTLLRAGIDRATGSACSRSASPPRSWPGSRAIRFLVGYLQRRTLLVFVAYRIVLGVLLLWLARG